MGKPSDLAVRAARVYFGVEDGHTYKFPDAPAEHDLCRIIDAEIAPLVNALDMLIDAAREFRDGEMSLHMLEDRIDFAATAAKSARGE